MFSDQFLIEFPIDDQPSKAAAIAPIAIYIATKSAALLASYRTAIDADERANLLVSLSSYALSASLLSLASITEDASLIDHIKTVIRKIERFPDEPRTIS